MTRRKRSRKRGQKEHKSPRVALYTRVSTSMQVEEGFSLDQQLREMHEFARQKGWEVVAEYIEAGQSGTTMDRPQLEALLQAAEEGAFDILLVHELSRLSRSVYDTFDIFEHLGQHHIGFASVREPQFNLTTPSGRFFLHIMASINQYYVDLLREEIKKGKRGRAAEGYTNASIAPFGYRRASDNPKDPLVIDPEEAEAVLMAYEAYATGQYTAQDIADMLNARGYRTRKGRRFSKEGVREILRNPFYKGYVVYRQGQHHSEGEIYPGKHEPIVSEELWDTVQQMLRRNQHRSSSFQPQARTYLLSQIAHCHLCGRTLRAQGAKRYTYYREMSRYRGYDDCPHTSVGAQARRLHALLGRIISHLRLPPDWQAELEEMMTYDDEEIVALQKQRARLLAERRRLREMYLAGDFEGDERLYRREMDRIKRQLALLPTPDDFLRVRRAAAMVESLAEVWEKATPEERQDMVRLLLKEVHVDVANQRLVRLYPYPVFIPLFRNVAMLVEPEVGVFVPRWPPEATDLLAYPQLPTLAQAPESPVLAPFLPTWPWPDDAKARVSPDLARLLKERRKAGEPFHSVVQVPHPGVPRWRVDARKWADVKLCTVPWEEIGQVPEASVHILHTPLRLQQAPDRAAVLQEAQRVLATGGLWYLLDLVPTSMPAHWAFTFFPGLWEVVREQAWDTQALYVALREAGFRAKVREQAFYQPVTLAVARTLARVRAGWLAHLSEEAYREGLARLDAAMEREGEGAVVGSEVVLVVAYAWKQ